MRSLTEDPARDTGAPATGARATSSGRVTAAARPVPQACGARPGSAPGAGR